MENKYARHRRLARKAMKSPLYILEKFKDYIAYIDPQLDKKKDEEKIKAIRRINYELLEMITEAGFAEKEELECIWKAAALRLKALTIFLRMAAEDRGKALISAKAYGHAAKLLQELDALLLSQAKGTAA